MLFAVFRPLRTPVPNGICNLHIFRIVGKALACRWFLALK
jgi:hypothetical protein